MTNKIRTSYMMSLTEALRRDLDEQCDCQCDDDIELDEEDGGGSTTNAIDGYQTPNAFGGTIRNDAIEVLGYKKMKKTNNWFKPMTSTKPMGVKESAFKSLAKEMNGIKESKYHDVKNAPQVSPKKKLNLAIAEVHKKLYEIEMIVSRNSKLKTEENIDNSAYWNITNEKLSRLSERMNRISDKLTTFK